MKQVIYRSITLIISGLGRIYNIRVCSGFDIVSILAKQTRICHFAKHKLIYAVALACMIRLRWYLKKQEQCDELTDIDNKQTTAIQTLLGIVGKSSTISYFQIAYALQSKYAKHLNLKKNHVFSNPNFLNLSIGQCFDDHEVLINFIQLKGKISREAKQIYGFDKNLNFLERNVELEVEEWFEPSSNQTGIQAREI